MQIIEYAKAHPWATGIVVVVGGIIFISITGIFKGGSGGSSSSSSAPSAAEIQANATVQAAQIQAQAMAAQAGAQVQSAQIGAGVQINSDNLKAQVDMESLRVQDELGLKQIDSQTATSLATIDAQKSVALGNQQAQVATQNIIAGVGINAANQAGYTARHGQSTGLIGGIIGGVLSIFSDERLKENVHLIGRNRQGLGVYAFNYRGSKNGHIGVIAQEVAAHDPSAVSVDHKTGYLKVDTSKIDHNYAMISGPGAAQMPNMFS